jgi:hypothetical protein
VVIEHLLVLDHSGYENYQTNVYLYGLYCMFHCHYQNNVKTQTADITSARVLLYNMWRTGIRVLNSMHIYNYSM